MNEICYIINDQGHAWPGGEKPWSYADQPSKTVIANDVMWDFFKKHHR